MFVGDMQDRRCGLTDSCEWTRLHAGLSRELAAAAGMALGKLSAGLVPVPVKAGEAPDEIRDWVQRQLVLGWNGDAQHDRLPPGEEHRCAADCVGCRLGAVGAQQ